MYFLVQLHGGVQACVEILRARKFYINELVSFKELISSISYSIPENTGEKHFIDKSAGTPCTSTHNVQDTKCTISLLEMCAEKAQEEVITKLDAPLRFKNIKIKQIKSAKDIIRKKTLICPEKIRVAKENMLTKILISIKYKSLFNSDTWGIDGLPELSISSQIIDSNIREAYYMDIQNDNIIENSFFIKKLL